MNNQLNGSSYYRANPYYQQGFIPDFALKNRKLPTHTTELPQGEQHFDPTNKKHFQRLGYFSTIAQQNIIHNKQEISSPSRDREYVRSLNVNDIQGATTNTLISKAVKNKLKHKQQLIRKKNQEQYVAQISQKQAFYARAEDERKQKQALQKIKKGNMPNYHQIVKKLRTQQAENIKNVTNTEQNIQKPNSPVYQRGYNQQNGNNNNNKNMNYPNGKQTRNDKDYEYYLNELKNTQEDIKYLQMKLSQVKDDRGFSNQPNNQAENTYNNRQQYEKYHQLMQNQNQNLQRESQGRERQRQRDRNYDYNVDSSKYQPEKYAQQRNPQRIPQYYLQPPQNPYNQENQRKISLNSDPINKKQEYDIGNPYSPNVNGYAGYQKSMSIKDLQPKEQREIHRRINPTFLSYGSGSIGLAGKNIVGF